MNQNCPGGLTALYKKVAPLLRPFGIPYAWLMRKRRARHALGKASSFRPFCPCISVGNIAMGGTGKTPLVAWFMRWALDRGLRAVVLSRGYKGNPGPEPLVVKPETGAELSGDEPLMLSRSFPDVPVIVFPRRAKAARFALRRFDPRVIILDDGMQHLSVSRDADIVVLRPEDLDESWNRVIPSGPWREDESALEAASAFVIKAEADAFAELAPLAGRRLARFGKPLFSFSLESTTLDALEPHGDGVKHVSQEELRETPYFLLSGVGNPTGVERTATRLMGKAPLRHFSFADHHPYDAADVRAVTSLAPVPLPVLCTPKDAVKLRPLAVAFGLFPVWVMRVEVVFGPALFTEQSFEDWWEDFWQNIPGAGVSERGSQRG